MGLYWVLLGFTGFYRVLPGFTGFYRVLPGFTGFYWFLPSFTGFYWVLPGFAVFGWRNRAEAEGESPVAGLEFPSDRGGTVGGGPRDAQCAVAIAMLFISVRWLLHLVTSRTSSPISFA